MNRFKNIIAASIVALGLIGYGWTQSFLREAPVIYWASSLPAFGSFAGQIAVLVDAGNDVTVSVWNPNDNAWENIAGDTADVFVDDITATGDITLGASDVDDTVINGPLTLNVVRQDFDQSCQIAQDDYTAEGVGDAEVNTAYCPDGTLNLFEFRLDGAHASPFIVDGAGGLDIDNNGIANEGVEIVLAASGDGAGGVVDVGTSAATYVQTGFTIASIDGTDNIQFGWRLAAAYVDNQVNDTINTGGQFNWDDALGNCMITTQDDTADTEDEITGCDLSDAEEIHLRVAVSTAGVFTFTYAATEALLETAPVTATKVVTVGVAAANDQLVPYFSMLLDTAADAEIKILYFEIGELQ